MFSGGSRDCFCFCGQLGFCNKLCQLGFIDVEFDSDAFVLAAQFSSSRLVADSSKAVPRVSDSQSD